MEVNPTPEQAFEQNGHFYCKVCKDYFVVAPDVRGDLDAYYFYHSLKCNGPPDQPLDHPKEDFLTFVEHALEERGML